MKLHKTLLFFCALSCMHKTVNAQITITNSDMPSVNDTFRLSTTPDTWSIDPTLTGTNYTWDFSFLTPQAQDIDTCVSVGSTPFLYQFYFNNAILYPLHKADFAVKGQDFSIPTVFTVTDVYDYFKKSSSAYQNVGFGANINGIPASVRKVPVEVVYEFPLNYLNTYSNYSEFELDATGIFSYKQKKNKTAEVDGWGTLITPLDTFSVLRVKFNIDITDSILVDAIGFPFVTPRPTETQYHWLAPGMDVPVLQINETSGVISQIIYKDIYRAVGIKEEHNSFMVNVYPNPTNNAFTIETDSEIEYVEMFNPMGELVYTAAVNNRVGKCATQMLESGLYVLVVHTANGSKNQKVLIER